MIEWRSKRARGRSAGARPVASAPNAVLALALAGCQSASIPLEVSAETLENAAAVAPDGVARTIALDSQAVRKLWKPLGPRVGLVQIHDQQQWHRFHDAAPGVGECPDLSRGAAIAIVSCTGTPLNGDWPISLESVQLHQGAGFVRADFHAGSYLPDGTAYIELAHVPGLASVLMVDVNGVRFLTE